MLSKARSSLNDVSGVISMSSRKSSPTTSVSSCTTSSKTLLIVILSMSRAQCHGRSARFGDQHRAVSVDADREAIAVISRDRDRAGVLAAYGEGHPRRAERPAYSHAVGQLSHGELG